MRSIVQTAIDAHQAGQINAQAAQAAKASKGSQTPRRERSGPNREGSGNGNGNSGSANNARAFDAFTANDDGVWHQGIDKDGQQKSPVWICSRLKVQARTRDQDGGGWGYYVAFSDPLGNVKQWAMPARMLSGDGGEYRATLLNMGLHINTTANARNLLTLFLSAGELGLADHMAEGMKRTRTGQEVRMADIPADAGAGLGAFENLHGHEGGAAFAKHVTHQAQAVYGATGRAWFEWLCAHADTLKASIREASAVLATQMIPEGASGQVERVGARFALVGSEQSLPALRTLLRMAEKMG